MNNASLSTLLDLGQMSQDVSQQLTWLLCHSLWQGLLIGIATVATHAFLQSASPNARYRVAVVALLLFVMCVPGTWLAGRTLGKPGEASARLRVAAARPELMQTYPDIVRTSLVSPPVASQSFGAAEWSKIASTGYLTGVCLMLLRLVISWLGIRRFGRRGSLVKNRLLLDRLCHLSDRIGLQVIPQLRVGGHAAIPIVFGVFRPIILLPTFAVSGMTGEELDAILLHELAHIQRGDLLINCLQRFAESLLFYHPVTWYLSRTIIVEREHCCDDDVLSRCHRLDYASALVRLAEFTTRPSQPLTALALTGARPSQLRRRVSRILGTTESNCFDKRGVLLVLAGVMLLSIAVLRSQAQTKPDQSVPDPAAQVVEQPAEETVNNSLPANPADLVVDGWSQEIQALIHEGKTLFDMHCAYCHGRHGKGNGPTAPYLNPPPRDFTKRESPYVRYKTEHATGDLRKVILQGIPQSAMPSFELLRRPQVDALTIHINYLASGILPQDATDKNLRFAPEIEKAMMLDAHRLPARAVPIEVDRGMMFDSIRQERR